MSPEEKVNNDFWWILREIRNEELLTTKGKSVEFRVRVQPKTSAKKKAIDDSNPIPSEDTQRKLLYKLKEWKALNLEPAPDILNDNMFNPPTRYFLTIHQEKFNELYRSYESNISHQENKEAQPAATPQGKPTIRLKTLELIAQKIGNLDSGSNLVNFLKNCGVDDGLIVYPNTKWRMVFDVLVYLASSSKKEDKETLSKVIGEATHPLMHNGNEGSALVLRKQFDEYLKYDNMGIAYDKDTGTYWALRNADDDEAKIQAQIKSDDFINELEEQSENQLKFLSQPENKEKISLLRKAYQLLMNVVFFFCEKPSNPTVELNDSFQYLFKLINKTINELGLWQVDKSPFSRNEHFFYLPFNNLFAAEKVYREQAGELSWQQIRPEMSAMYGDIEELYREVNGSDILAEPDKQKKLNEIQLHLSELKKKTKETKEKLRSRNEPQATLIEITKLPPLQFSNPSDDKLSRAKIAPADVLKFVLSVKDREIWVNDYVIGKPHAVGSNFEFFDYVRRQPPNTQIEWRTIPDKIAWEMMKKAIQGRRFIKILHALGFKGEIKKAFFYKVGIDTLYYRGDEITKKDLENAGVKVPLFLKELEVAHTKIVPNSPI